MKVQLFVLPLSIKGNPYLELLYQAVNVDGEYDIRPFSFLGIFSALLGGRSVMVHIHWESNLYGSAYLWVSLVRMLYRFPLLFLARSFGARVVWTMHNLSAHDYPHPPIDRLGRYLMWRLAQGVIIQNKVVSEEMRLRHTGKVVRYIPHGNYVGVYGPMQPPQAHEGVVLLALGAVRPYKRLEMLVDAVKEAPSTRLVIAGKADRAYVAELRRRAAGAPVEIQDFVPDEKVAEYFSTGDYAVFTHSESSLTSGAVIVALSYGVPVIALPMPAAELVEEGRNGFVVEDKAALVALLKKLPSLPRMPQEKVVASVNAYSWERVGKETRAVYAQLL